MKKITLLFLVAILSSWSSGAQTFPEPYCDVSFITVEPITLVDVAGISNISDAALNGTPSHEDFTAIVGNMQRGETYAITLEGNTAGASFSSYFTVFIDWDQDGILDNFEERYEIGSITGSTGTDGQQITGNIVVPATAISGPTRMRVVKSYNAHAVGSCYVGSNYGQVEDYTIDVLDPSDCNAVDNVTLSEITENSARVSWTVTPTAINGYEVNVFLEGANPETDSAEITETVDAGISTVTISGLADGTGYDVYVVSDCGSDTAMSTVVTFTTGEGDGCAAVSVPYIMDFESATVPDLPECTSREKIGNVKDWETANVSTYGFDSVVLKRGYDSTNASNAWFYTQGIEMEGGTEYEISYKYGNDDSFGDTEKMEVAYGSSPNAAAMTTQLADHPSITGGIPSVNTVTFAPTTSGVYYFGFHSYSDANQWYFYLDDISIQEAASESCDPVTDIVVTDITENSATVSWTDTSSATGGYIVMGYLEGADPEASPMEFTEVVAADVSTVEITALEENTAYDVYVMSICGTDSTMSSAVTFTTDQTAGINGNEISNIKYFPNPVNDNLTITAAKSIDSVSVYNLLGQQVMQAQPRNMNVVLDLSSLSTGTYVLKANAADSVSTFKVVKK